MPARFEGRPVRARAQRGGGAPPGVLARRAGGRFTVIAGGERTMLFAATSFTRSVHALQRAHRLASAWRGSLYVLLVAPPGALSQGANGAGGGELGRARAALRTVRRFCRRSLPSLPPRDHMLVKQGDFASVVADTARELDADLVVISGAERQKGTRVARLSQRAQAPVLVARRAARDGVIVAATDFADPTCSELAHAARFARGARELAFVHNVRPVVHAANSALGHCVCTVIEPSPQALAESRARLLALAAHFGVRALPLVLTRASDEEAILEAARAHDADLVVVGARRQRWLERLFGTTLAGRIVDRCEHSVLVTPIRERAVAVAVAARP